MRGVSHRAARLIDRPGNAEGRPRQGRGKTREDPGGGRRKAPGRPGMALVRAVNKRIESKPCTALICSSMGVGDNAAAESIAAQVALLHRLTKARFGLSGRRKNL